MNLEHLISTASNINNVDEKSQKEYSEKYDILFAEMNSLMSSRADLKQLIGENNLAMMRDNHANHLRFMATIFKSYSPEIFVSTVLWVFRAYRSHGFATNYWATQINCWLEVFKNNLSNETYNDIYPFYEWIQVNIPILTLLSDAQLNLPNSMH